MNVTQYPGINGQNLPVNVEPCIQGMVAGQYVLLLSHTDNTVKARHQRRED
jgi:hypothetical protein